MTLSSTRQRTPSFPSTSSLNHASSVRRPPPITVITSPRASLIMSYSLYQSLIIHTAWARDEPPSPKDQTSVNDSHLVIESRPSDVASHHSTYASDLGSRWWAFTLPRPREHPPVQVTSSPKSERKGLTFKDRSISWLPTSAIREGTSFSRREKGPEAAAEDENNRDWNFRLSLPPPVAPSFTLAHNITPGWETPWTARVAAQGPRARDNPYFLGDEEEESDDSNKNATLWQIRKKRFRAFILTNAYVPLVSFTYLQHGHCINGSPAFSIRKHHVYNICSRYCNSNATMGDATQHHGCCWQFSVCFLKDALKYTDWHLL